MRRITGKWSDEYIAATFNRMGLSTGQVAECLGIDVVRWEAFGPLAKAKRFEPLRSIFHGSQDTFIGSPARLHLERAAAVAADTIAAGRTPNDQSRSAPVRNPNE